MSAKSKDVLKWPLPHLKHMLKRRYLWAVLLGSLSLTKNVKISMPTANVEFTSGRLAPPGPSHDTPSGKTAAHPRTQLL